MTSNQIAGYNGRFRFPRALCTVFTVSVTVLRDAGVKLEYIYFFTSGMAGHGWNTKINIECECKRFLCDVLTLLGESKSLGKCNQSSSPDRVDNRWRYRLLWVRKLWSRFVCLHEVLRQTNSIRESKEECRRYQREICSIYQSIKDY